jgi:exopolysaccharide biosynthesis polyprenyl glycosylphosphotransferase
MLKNINKHYKYLFLIYDLVFIVITIFLAPFIRFEGSFDEYISFGHPQLYLIVFIYIFVFYIFDLYAIRIYKTKWSFIVNYTYAFIFTGIFVAAFFYIFTNLKYGRGIWLIQLGLSYCILALGRFIVINYINIRIPKKRILILGGSTGEHIIEEELTDAYCDFLGYIGEKKAHAQFKYLGNVNKVDNYINELNPDAIVVADRSIIRGNTERSILKAKMRGIYIYDMPSIIEVLKEKVPVHHINDHWVIYNSFSGLHVNQYNLRFKRFLDIVISAFGLIISSPIIMFTAIIIKLESKGPVFYRQTRVGLNENPFRIIKFRSMQDEAEENGAVWAKKNDSRITGFGRIIRKLRIDELPQLLNVLKGEMTIVGPRPERPEFVEMLKKEIPYYSLRHLIRPGITGWAQINYPYGASIRDARHKLEYDLYYMRHLTLRLDISIILKTIKIILFGKGAR